MCYPVCGMVHIKEPLLLIGKSSPLWQQQVSSLAICIVLYHVSDVITINKNKLFNFLNSWTFYYCVLYMILNNACYLMSILLRRALILVLPVVQSY